MLWPLVLFVLAATIEAGDVKTPKSIGIRAGKSAAGVKPVKSNGNAKSSSTGRHLERVANTIGGDGTIDFNLINGTEADIDEFPFYAMLSKRVHVDGTMETGAPIKLLCGSSLVHPKFLISAWHCFKKDQDPKHVVAVFHITNRCKPDVKSIAWHDLHKIHFYPGSITNRKTKRHDLVLIELQHEVTDVSPLLMPSQPPTVGTVGTIIGFGRTAWSKKKIDDQVPCTLRKTFETVEAWEKCRHPGENVIGAFCGVATTTTACRGDSGGPWLTWNNGAYELQGVVSFGSVQCDAKQANDHYTNVFAYKDWIFTTIRNSLMTKNQARASSAILEPHELSAHFNAIDHGEPHVEQKYTARAPVFPQYLHPPPHVIKTVLSGSKPFDNLLHKSANSAFFSHPSAVQTQFPQPFHSNSLQWPQISQLQTPYQWPQANKLQTPSQWLQPQQQQQTPQQWQPVQPQQQLQHWQQPQIPQQSPAIPLQILQPHWNLQQLQFALFCHGQVIPPPSCFPHVNYQQQPSHSDQQQQSKPLPHQQQLSLVSLARSVSSNTPSAAPPVDKKQKSPLLQHHK